MTAAEHADRRSSATAPGSGGGATGNHRASALPGPAKVTTAILVVLVLGGVVLRLHQLGAAAFFTFDEELFVRPAHGYLYGRPDGNDHPPLGKLVLAVGMLLFGENPVGWRFSSAVIGVHNVFIAGWLGSELFGSRRAGAFAAAAVAADGFFLAYSRAGLLDGTLVCLVMWSVLAAARARTVLGVLESVLLVGLAATVKWSGAFAVFPAAATVLALGKVPRATILLFGLFPLLHAVLWMAALGLTGRPNDPRALWDHAAHLFRHHQALGTRDNELASPWYSWIALHHPIVVKLSHHGLRSRYASTVANLALWAVGTALVVGGPLAAAAATGVGRVARRWPRAGATRVVAWVLRARDAVGRANVLRPLLLCALGWAALLAPWTVGRGKFTFHYHYFPSHAFTLIAVAGAAAAVERSRPRAVLGYFALVLGVAVYFAPVWSEYPLAEAAANRRLVPVLWRP